MKRNNIAENKTALNWLKNQGFLNLEKEVKEANSRAIRQHLKECTDTDLKHYWKHFAKMPLKDFNRSEVENFILKEVMLQPEAPLQPKRLLIVICVSVYLIVIALIFSLNR